MKDINLEQYTEMIKRNHEACKNDTLILYARNHKNRGTSLKELAKRCNTQELTLEPILSNK